MARELLLRAFVRARINWPRLVGMERREFLKFMAAVGAIMTVIIIPGFILSRGETLYDCSFQLHSDKDAYRLGDVILLTHEIIPKTARTLTLNQQLYNNIRISNLENCKERQRNGKPVRYKLSPEKPLSFKTTGRISRGEDGIILVDFGDYGRAQIKEKELPPLRFSVMPYKIPRADSVKWDRSNELQLRLVD